MSQPASDFAPLLKRLAELDRERRAIIGKLLTLGRTRTRNLVGEIGERLAADYYGVPLASASTPGYDLVTVDGKRVQVRALRSTPENRRSVIGVLRGGWDVLLAIRLDEDYLPLEAIETPRATVERHFGNGRVTWSKRLADDPTTKRITGEALMAAERAHRAP